IMRPTPSKPLIRRTIDGVATFELDQVLNDPADDPVSARAFRDIVALEPEVAARLQPGGLTAAQMVSEVTGGDAEGTAEGGHATPGARETDVLPAGVPGTGPAADDDAG